jgi:hypothetical protein
MELSADLPLLPECERRRLEADGTLEALQVFEVEGINKNHHAVNLPRDARSHYGTLVGITPSYLESRRGYGRRYCIRASQTTKCAGAGKAFAKLIFYLDYCKQTARLAKSFVLAEACVSRTHRQHRRCRPPVLKTGTITGPHALPHFADKSAKFAPKFVELSSPECVGNVIPAIS